MKASLQLRLGHQLTMTPQLQQAIRLLQLSTLDLQAELQQALESNPMLEQLDEAQEQDTLSNTEMASVENNPWDSVDTIPSDLPVDSRWDEIYPSNYTPSTSSTDDENLDFIGQQASQADSLRDHLLWQLRLTPFSLVEQAIATTLIDAISDDGYLRQPIEEIEQALNPQWQVSHEQIIAVLEKFQQFDPSGVGARDLRECLLSQIHGLPSDTPYLELATTLIASHLDLLAGRLFSQLKRKLKVDEDTLIKVVRLIQSLDPHPGYQIRPSTAEYIIPDVLLSKKNNRWLVELNPDAIPKMRINGQYAALVKRADNSVDNTYLRGQLQEARWLLKSLESRNETMLKVATCIVEHQLAYFEHGEEAMKPLVLHDIADAINMHESTISRVTTQKYMHTPRGIFELKYFFSSHVSTTTGGECSSVAIRAIIKKLVAAESPSKPLSDNKIAEILHDQGIRVARRTVAKYREALNIPSSNERKRLE